MLKSDKAAFTLIELLVVIAIIAILGSLILPTLGKAKAYSKRIKCQSQMKQWSLGALLYLDDWNNELPDVMDRTIPYILDSSNYSNATYRGLKFCPSGGRGAPPYSNKPELYETEERNCRILEILGPNTTKKITAPFALWSKQTEFVPARADSFRRPSEVMLYMDGFIRIRSPRESRQRFARDMKSDGQPDTSVNYFNLGIPFNGARPTVHNEGANAPLLDGHVEWESYEKLWNLDSAREMTHPFWRFE